MAKRRKEDSICKENGMEKGRKKFKNGNLSPQSKIDDNLERETILSKSKKKKKVKKNSFNANKLEHERSLSIKTSNGNCSTERKGAITNEEATSSFINVKYTKEKFISNFQQVWRGESEQTGRYCKSYSYIVIKYVLATVLLLAIATYL